MADSDFTDDDGVGTDPDAVFEGWGSTVGATAGSANGDAVGDVDVGTEDGMGADDDSAEVADVEPRADDGLGRDIEAELEAVTVQQNAMEDVGDKEDGLAARVEVSDFAQVVGEAEAGILKPRADESLAPEAGVVAVEVSFDESCHRHVVKLQLSAAERWGRC